MTMRFAGVFELEGSEYELAAYTFCLMEVLRMKNEKDQEQEVKKELEILEKLGNMSFEELMQRERETCSGGLSEDGYAAPSDGT